MARPKNPDRTIETERAQTLARVKKHIAANRDKVNERRRYLAAVKRNAARGLPPPPEPGQPQVEPTDIPDAPPQMARRGRPPKNKPPAAVAVAASPQDSHNE